MPNIIAKKAKHYYSPSQIQTYDLCPRKWGWTYIEGFRSPSTASQQLGTNVHKVLERWLGEGVAPDTHTREGKIATAGLGLLPLPSPDVKVEGYFAFELEGLNFRGYKDLRYVDEDGAVVVLDHKTTSDFKWALTEDDLPVNPQALIYAKDEIDRNDLDSVRLRWIYYLTTRNRERAREVQVEMTREEVNHAMRPIVDTAHEMEHLRLTVLGAKDLPISPDACAAYGGCEHADRCKLTTKQRMRAIMVQEGKKRMKLADKLKQRALAKKKQKQQEEVDPVGESTPEMNPPEAPSDEEALAAKAEPKKTKKKVTTKKKRVIAPKKLKKVTKKATAKEPEENEEPEEAMHAQEAEEQPEESTKRRGRPKGSVNLRKVALVIPDYATASVLLNLAALAGGASEEAFVRVDEVLKGLKSKL